jgi:bifunctional UDP-N-acetylglucosamine pyrophosphorylase/glucosamine-1-phosphate N-acetyltransferase
MNSIAVVILAAGLGKRMGSDLPKALVSTIEKPLIEHVLATVKELNAERVVVVTGHAADKVRDCSLSAAQRLEFGATKVLFALQEKQLGTGDAVRAALPCLKDFHGSVLVLCADMPLVRQQTLAKLIELHGNEKATLSFITLVTSEPASYGRVIRDTKTKRPTKIIEARDCTAEQLAITEINAAMYVVDSAFLAPAVSELKNNNAQKEFYLTDIVERAANEGQTISTLVSTDSLEIQGVNTRLDLAAVNAALRRKAVAKFIEHGVIFDDPTSCFIDTNCSIGSGTRIGPNVQLLGASTVGNDVTIEGSAYIRDSQIGNNVLIRFSVRAEKASIGENAKVGPFAHLRPGTILAGDVHIGNFVETKNAVIKSGAKANHLSYLGDCHVGENSNIGAGTITCNYDGYRKSHTEIGKGVFVGSNSSLVAPLTIEDGATIAAGSVITRKVESDALAISRAEQVTKAGWSKRKREVESKKR